MRFSTEEKAQWVADWRESGKNAWRYAKENGLIPQTFSGWTKARRTNKAGFVEIAAAVMAPPQQAEELVIEKGGIKIHTPVTISCDKLRMIISILGGAA